MTQQGRGANQLKDVITVGSRSQRCGLNVPVKTHTELGVVVCASNPSTREAEAGSSLNSRLTWSTYHILGQPTSPKTKQNKFSEMYLLLSIYSL